MKHCKFLATEYEQCYDADGYAGIGEVEYRGEEDIRLSAPYREPFGIGGDDDGEVEHVHYPTLEDGCIARAKIYEERLIIGGGTREYQSIEYTVDEVARRPRQHY